MPDLWREIVEEYQRLLDQKSEQAARELHEKRVKAWQRQRLKNQIVDRALETAGVGGQTWGPLVATWAKAHMGVDLMGWQVHALEGMLMLADDTGELHFREGLVSTARQNGKSVLLQAVVGWFLTDGARLRGRPQAVLSVANRLDRAEAIHTAVAPILEAQYGAKVTNAVGRKAVLMPDGSKWEVRAATPNLHGGSYDLIVVDELFDIGSNCIDDALRQYNRRSGVIDIRVA